MGPREVLFLLTSRSFFVYINKKETGFFYFKMAKLNENNLKLAIQKEGRLTDETLSFLQKSGIEFESYKQRLFSVGRNFPLEILFVRDDDIPGYVSSGVADLGILGLNVVYEEKPDVQILLNMGYGFCYLTVGVPKESKFETVYDLKNKTIATSYPKATQEFFDKMEVPIKLIKINGSVELAPTLGVAQAIADLTSTGSTMALNDLRPLTKIYDSQAVLIGNNDSLRTKERKKLIDRLIMRFKGVLAAKNYKYIMMNAPEKILPKLKETVPGLKSPTVAPLAEKGWISVQTVIREDVFWETIEKLKELGASGILVLPIEKIIL